MAMSHLPVGLDLAQILLQSKWPNLRPYLGKNCYPESDKIQNVLAPAIGVEVRLRYPLMGF